MRRAKFFHCRKRGATSVVVEVLLRFRINGAGQTACGFWCGIDGQAGLELRQAALQCRVAQRQNLHGQQPGILRAIDGDRGHRHARRHLRDDTTNQGPSTPCPDWHADYRQHLDAAITQAVRGAARAGDEDTQSAFARRARTSPRHPACGAPTSRGLARHAESAHTSSAAFIVGQSESLPMTMPTNGLLGFHCWVPRFVRVHQRELQNTLQFKSFVFAHRVVGPGRDVDRLTEPDHAPGKGQES